MTSLIFAWIAYPWCPSFDLLSPRTPSSLSYTSDRAFICFSLIVSFDSISVPATCPHAVCTLSSFWPPPINLCYFKGFAVWFLCMNTSRASSLNFCIDTSEKIVPHFFPWVLAEVDKGFGNLWYNECFLFINKGMFIYWHFCIS